MATPTDRRRPAIRSFFELVTTALASYDRGWTTADRTGAALWVPAGQPSLTDDAGAALGALLEGLGEETASRTVALIGAMEHEHPEQPHEYLWFLGVAPQAQGRGIGSALLEHGLARADTVGLPAYLEATSLGSKALYERHGFVASTPITVLDCPPLWPMRRPVGGR